MDLVLDMAITTGTKRYIPITQNHDYMEASFSHFPYSIDMSSVLSSDARFKGYINNTNNIAVYDPLGDSTLPKYVFLDKPNNKLIIYFDCSCDSTSNKTFYVCAGGSVNQANNAATWTNSVYNQYWPIKEFSNGSLTSEVIGGYDLSVVSSASIGNSGLFGNAARNTGSDGYIYMNPPSIVLPVLVDRSIEFLIYINGYGGSGVGRILAAYPLWIIVRDVGGTCCLTYSNDDFITSFNHAITMNQWHHVTIIRLLTGGVYVYVDGNGSPGYSGGSVQNNDNFYLLGDWSSNAFDGYISDVGIIGGEASLLFSETRSNMFRSPNTFWTIGSGVNIRISDLMTVL